MTQKTITKSELRQMIKEALLTEQLSKPQQYRLALQDLDDCISRLKIAAKSESMHQTKKMVFEIIRELENERDAVVLLTKD